MNKNVSILIAVFLLSMLLTVMFNPTFILLMGMVVCLIAALKYRAKKVAEKKLEGDLLFRSGLAFISGVIVAVAFVFAAMSGLFGK